MITGSKILITLGAVTVLSIVCWVVVMTPKNDATDYAKKVQAANADTAAKKVYCTATSGGYVWQVYTQGGAAYVTMGSVTFPLGERWNDDVTNQFVSGGVQGKYAAVFTLVGGAGSGVACVAIATDGTKAEQWGMADSEDAEKRAIYDIASAAISAYDNR
jgi:hypothetical protein